MRINPDLRRRVIARDGRFCRYCGRTVQERRNRSRAAKAKDTLTLDHVVPLSVGGSSTKDNLVVACRECNSKKGPHRADHFALLHGTVPPSERTRRSDEGSSANGRPAARPSHQAPGSGQLALVGEPARTLGQTLFATPSPLQRGSVDTLSERADSPAGPQGGER